MKSGHLIYWKENGVDDGYGYTAKDSGGSTIVNGQGRHLSLAEITGRLGSEVMHRIETGEGHSEKLSSMNNNAFDRGTLSGVDLTRLPIFNQSREAVAAQDRAIVARTEAAVSKLFKKNHSAIQTMDIDDAMVSHRSIVTSNDFTRIDQIDVDSLSSSMINQWVDGARGNDFGLRDVDATENDIKSLSDTLKAIGKDADMRTSENLKAFERDLDEGVHNTVALDNYIERQRVIVLETSLQADKALSEFNKISKEYSRTREELKGFEKAYAASPGDELKTQIADTKEKLEGVEKRFTEASQTFQDISKNLTAEQTKLDEAIELKETGTQDQVAEFVGEHEHDFDVGEEVEVVGQGMSR